MNEVGPGLMIVESLEGVPVNFFASIMMSLVNRSRGTVCLTTVALWFLRWCLLPQCPCFLCIYRGFRYHGYLCRSGE